MKAFSKSLLAAAVLSVTATTATFAQATELEVGASVGVSNLYLFRGADLGDGSAQLWGDLSATYGGLYGGIWASSGDDTLGTEYDLYAGYAGEFSGISYDVGFINYIYPGAETSFDTDTNSNTTSSPQSFADFTESLVTIGYAGFSFTHVKTVAGADASEGTSYRAYGYENGPYSVVYGDFADATADGHLDLTYAYSDNLSFTTSFGIDSKTSDNETRDPLFVVALSLPIE